MMFLFRISLVCCLMTLLPALAVHLCCLRNRPGVGRCRRILWTVTALEFAGIACFIAFAFGRGSLSQFWHLFFCVFMGIVGVESSMALFGALAKVFGRREILRHLMLCLGAVMVILDIIMVAMAFIIGNKRIDVAEYTYFSRDLPESFDGFRIVHISDLHLGTYSTDTARVAELIDKALAQKGDMIVFTGDLVNFESKEALPFVNELSRLRAPYGVYSVFGNHDYGVYRNFATKREQLADIQKLTDIEKSCGWTVLRNAHDIIHKDGDSIVVVGVDNDGHPPFPRLADIPKALKGLPSPGGFMIFLTHDPSHWRRNVLGETTAQLTLSGHTHGMQFKLGEWSPASLVYKEWGGQYFEGQRSLIVSIGLGLGAVPFRFGAWSEVCVVTLRTQK